MEKNKKTWLATRSSQSRGAGLPLARRPETAQQLDARLASVSYRTTAWPTREGRNRLAAFRLCKKL